MKKKCLWLEIYQNIRENRSEFKTHFDNVCNITLIELGYTLRSI
jgi:hypothetical protein